MKRIFALLLVLALALCCGVCVLAETGPAVNEFDPALDIVQSDDGKTITVTMNTLPDGLSAQLVIPCKECGNATVKAEGGTVVASTFDKANQTVTFDAAGGTYTITLVPLAVSSSSSNGGTTTDDFTAVSKDITKRLKSAQKGETVTAELGSTNKLDAGVLDALRSNSGVALQLTQNGKVVLEIPAGAALASEPGRIYYTLAELQKLYSQPLEAEVPAAETPAAAEAESAQPEQSAAPEEPADAAAEAPVAEPEKEIDEQEASAAEKVEEEARSGGSSVVIGLVVVAAVALAAILIILFKKKQEEE